MKKYFCKTCGEFKSRLQVRFVESHYQVLEPECKWCHTRNVVTAEELIEGLYKKLYEERREGQDDGI